MTMSNSASAAKASAEKVPAPPPTQVKAEVDESPPSPSLHGFSCVSDNTPTFASESAQEQLKKWGFTDFWQLKRYSFRQKFDPSKLAATGDKDAPDTYLRSFLLDLFGHPEVRRTLEVAGPAAGSKPKLASITQSLGPDVRPKNIEFKQLLATKTSMAFFDRLEESGVVRAGRVTKCAEDVFDGATVADEMRAMLVDECSEHSCLFEPEREQNELLFRIFKHLAVGGSMCQWEDRVGPVLDATKGLYKDLLTVHRSTSDGGITVASIVVEIKGIEWVARGKDAHPWLFPDACPHSFCYVVICPLKRSATIWYHAWTSWW
jgi:hypothetical protein